MGASSHKRPKSVSRCRDRAISAEARAHTGLSGGSGAAHSGSTQTPPAGVLAQSRPPSRGANRSPPQAQSPRPARDARPEVGARLECFRLLGQPEERAHTGLSGGSGVAHSRPTQTPPAGVLAQSSPPGRRANRSPPQAQRSRPARDARPEVGARPEWFRMFGRPAVRPHRGVRNHGRSFKRPAQPRQASPGRPSKARPKPKLGRGSVGGAPPGPAGPSWVVSIASKSIDGQGRTPRESPEGPPNLGQRLAFALVQSSFRGVLSL